MLSVQTRQTHSMRTRDGIRLDADVYIPMGKGPFPVLLMRQPYGRAIASTIVYAHPRWYAAHGYIVIIQDVRGRGTSEGDFNLFAYEVGDGADTIEWASQFPGSDGQIGMYGFSYQGMTQLYAAQTKISALKTIVPAMTGYHLYEDWAYENGALCLQLGLTWAIQLAAETARLQGKHADYQRLLTAARNLPLEEAMPARPTVLEGVQSFLHDWISHPHQDSYWEALTPELSSVDLPSLHIGGWMDPYLRGDIRLYQELSAKPQHPHHLWIGPWGHIPWGRKVGAMDFGAAAMNPVDNLQIQWFNAILKGQSIETAEQTNGVQPSLSASQPVCLFEMGRNRWRQLPNWQNASMHPYVLQSDGLSNIREDSGTLVDSSVLELCDQSIHNKTNSHITANNGDIAYQDSIVHDPWNPAPALGGHSAIPAGVFERTAIDHRGDVLTYTTTPLTTEMRVAGVAKVVAKMTSSASSFDISAVLSRVTKGGTYNLTQGYQHIREVKPNQPTPITLPLHPTCFNIAPGEALRLSLSLACFPAYPINPGTGAQPALASLIEAQIITVEITIGGQHGAELRLPVTNKAG